MLRLILKENYFQLSGKLYLQAHGTAMGTKTAVSFANVFIPAKAQDSTKKLSLM